MKIINILRDRLYIACLLPLLFAGCMKEDFILEEGTEVEITTRTQADESGVFYYYFDEKIYLEPQTDQVFLEFAPDATKAQFQAIASSTASLQTKKSNREARFIEGSAFNTIIMESQAGKEISSTDLRALKAREEIVSASYLFEYEGHLSAVTNEFSVKLKGSTSYGLLQALATKNDCEVREHEWFGKDEYLVIVPKTSDSDAIQMANVFYETGLFEFTSPYFVHFNAFSSNDTHYSSQWGLKNTGQYGGTTGIDIRAEQAWTITKGAGINVAVIDTGVELTHPDLQANLLSGYDAAGQNSGGAPSLEDNHGTAVAGIIGATQNDIGVSGVAPECKIIPIRAGDDYYGIQDSWAVAAFNWAWQNGADVINCSWGGSQPNAQLTTATNNAATQGRGGKGCVVVFSSGNDKGGSGKPVNYTARPWWVMAVGAVSYNGQRASFSNYGPELDVIAPGVYIYTTDKQGSYPHLGYAPGDYMSNFDGTSAAAPMVSGIAALVLSAYPNLSAEQVKMVIEKGCTPLPGYSYTYNQFIYPNGPWNQEIGYGLVNAYEALQEAYLETQLDIWRATPGVDFLLTNESSLDLESIYIQLTGNVGGSNTTFFGCDPGTLPSGGYPAGFPTYPGINLTASPGTPITDLALELWAITRDNELVTVTVAWDESNPTAWTNINFGGGGNAFYFSPPDTTVPSPSANLPAVRRRTLNIRVTDPY